MSEQAPRPWYRSEWAGVLAVTLVGAALRLYKLADNALWYDEGSSIYLGRYVPEPWKLFDPNLNTEAPLNAVITWCWRGLIDLFGYPVTTWQSDFLFRLLPCLLGIATIPILYGFARRLLNDPVAALIAAALLAISPFFVYYSQELRIYAFIVPASLLTFWAMLCALEEGKPQHWVAFVLGLALLPYAHMISVWTIFSLSVYFMCVWVIDRRKILSWTIANSAVMLLIIPALILAYEMNEMVSQITVKWHTSPTWKSMLITFKTFVASYGPTAWAYWPLFGLALGLHLFGLAVLLRKRWRAAAFIGVFTWVFLYGNVILWSVRDFSYYEHRLFIVPGAVALIGVAAGLRALPWPLLRWGTALTWLLFTAPMLRDHYLHRLHPIHEHRWGMFDKVDFRNAAAYIDSQWQEGDLIVYPFHFFVYSMHHYTDKPHLRIGIDDREKRKFVQLFSHEQLSIEHGLMPVTKEDATKDAKRLWYIEAHGIVFESFEHNAQIRNWLDTEWKAVEQRDYYGLVVKLYTRP